VFTGLYKSETSAKREQVDTLILDFSKAFDTVPHQRLVNKMEHYGIKGNTHRWVSSWLTQRHQRVCVDGEESSNKPVISVNDTGL
jgi:methylaspartate ammonia-lyase